MKPRKRVPKRRFAIVRTLFPTELKFEGNRAIVFDESDAVPTDSLAFCIAAALTYHRKRVASLRR
jgi:Na+-transporting methylmalonyl-CoA/oxaloacetate decarboxylase gamma subunit